MIPPSKQKISYSPESIKISFVLGENLFNSLQTAPKETSFLTGQENPAPEVRGGVNCLPENFSALMQKTEPEFVSFNDAPDEKIQRTFTFVLPNLIYKLKTLLPKPKRKQKGI